MDWVGPQVMGICWTWLGLHQNLCLNHDVDAKLQFFWITSELRCTPHFSPILVCSFPSKINVVFGFSEFGSVYLF